MNVGCDQMGRDLFEGERNSLDCEYLVCDHLKGKNHTSGEEFLSQGVELRPFYGLEDFQLYLV